MLLYVSLFTILLSLILLINNWDINRNAIYLALFLICASIYGIAHYFVVYGKSSFWLAIFYNHFTPLMLLLGPLLLFYVRGTIKDNFRLSNWDAVHFIPALIHLIGIIPYSLLPFEEKIRIAHTIITNVDEIITINTNYFYNSAISFVIRPVLLLGYILYCMMLLWKRFKNSKLDVDVPQKQLFISLRWLIILLVSLFFIVFEFLIITYNSLTIKPSVGLINSYPLYILSGAAYGIMSLSLLMFPNVLYGIPKRIVEKEKNKEVKLKKHVVTLQDESAPLEEDPFYELSESIKVYLEKERPYLNSDFSLSDIALAMQVPQNHVSYCINTIMQTKFSTLKADLRINYTLELFSGKLKESYTIEGIAQQAGFKTRASFYSAFKEKTGVTPTEFIATATT
jgi:AraC-like DNA-binding protein